MKERKKYIKKKPINNSNTVKTLVTVLESVPYNDLDLYVDHPNLEKNQNTPQNRIAEAKPNFSELREFSTTIGDYEINLHYNHKNGVISFLVSFGDVVRYCRNQFSKYILEISDEFDIYEQYEIAEKIGVDCNLGSHLFEIPFSLEEIEEKYNPAIEGIEYLALPGEHLKILAREKLRKYFLERDGDDTSFNLWHAGLEKLDIEARCQYGEFIKELLIPLLSHAIIEMKKDFERQGIDYITSKEVQEKRRKLVKRLTSNSHEFKIHEQALYLPGKLKIENDDGEF